MVDGWRRDHQASERGVDLASAVTRLCHECDVAVVGGSMGGVATALAAADAGCKVVLTSGTDWRGGQMTSQGVSDLNEHR